MLDHKKTVDLCSITGHLPRYVRDQQNHKKRLITLIDNYLVSNSITFLVGAEKYFLWLLHSCLPTMYTTRQLASWASSSK